MGRLNSFEMCLRVGVCLPVCGEVGRVLALRYYCVKGLAVWIIEADR